MGTPGQNLDNSWLPAGMDPKSTYLLEIRISGNPKTRRKEFSCFSFSKIVDSDLCNFKDLVGEIVDQYPHGYQEVVHVFYYDDVQKCFPQVTTDQELLEMFRKPADSKVVCMTITYTEPTDVVPIPECYSPENSEMLDIPCTPSMACPSLAAASQSTQPILTQHSKPTANESTEPSTNDEPNDHKYLENPEPHNEHVGVDDEGFYFDPPKAHVEEKIDSESDSESYEEYGEEEGLIGKDPLPPMPIVAYDRDDPPMNVGSLYPNMEQFKLALSQHAICWGLGTAGCNRARLQGVEQAAGGGACATPCCRTGVERGRQWRQKVALNCQEIDLISKHALLTSGFSTHIGFNCTHDITATITGTTTIQIQSK